MSGQKNSWRLWIALFGAVLPTSALVAVSPLLNATAMAARDLDTGEIGLIRTSEILTNAIFTLALSTQLTTMSPRLIALFGLTLYVVGCGLAIPGDGFWDLLGARVLSGAGLGCVVAAGAAFYAQLVSPQRVAGALLIPWTAASVICALTAGRAAENGSQLGLFGILAATGLVAILAVAFAPAGKAIFPGGRPKPMPIAQAIRHPYALAVMVLFFGSTASWHYFAKVGMAHGLAQSQIGIIIASVGVLGAIVTAIGAIMMRDGMVRVIVLCALICFASAATTVPISTGETLFIVAYALQSASYVLIAVALPAVGLKLDNTGSLNASAQGMQTFANAFAPATGGYLLLQTGGGFWPLSVLCAICGVITIGLFAFATRKARQSP